MEAAACYAAGLAGSLILLVQVWYRRCAAAYAFARRFALAAALCLIRSLTLQAELLIQATCPFLPQARSVPTAVLLAAPLLAVGSAAVNAVLLQRSSQGSDSRGTAAWRLWRVVLCATGFAMLPQVRHLPAVRLSDCALLTCCVCFGRGSG